MEEIDVRGYRVKLSKGSLLLLHLAAAGHVWRDDKGFWVASTERTKRNVQMRISKLIHQGVLIANHKDSFPRVTALGEKYMIDNPLEDVLQATTIR